MATKTAAKKTAAKKKADPVAVEAPDSPVTRFEFTVPGREVTQEINARIPTELGGARQAASACFSALYDPGSNSPTTVMVEQLPDSITVSVVQHPYVHGT